MNNRKVFMTKSLVGNAADREQVKKAKQKQEDRLKDHRHDVVEILSSESGRRFYWELLSYCGVFELSYQENRENHVYFKEGMRNVGLKLMSEATGFSPDLFYKMMDEAVKRGKK